MLFDLKTYRASLYPVWKHRKLLRGCEPEHEPDKLDEAPSTIHSAGMVIGTMLLALCLMLATCQPAHAQTTVWSDNQIADAIRHAEGSWTYGIKTVSCSSESVCRRVCLTTIRNNRRRFKEYGFRHYPRFIDFLQSRPKNITWGDIEKSKEYTIAFIDFLGSRYCPVKGKVLTLYERKYNIYWITNIKYFLKKGQLNGQKQKRKIYKRT